MECKICEKRFSGIENYKQHEVSEKHKKKVQLHLQTNGTVDSELLNSEMPFSKYSCTVCMKSFLTLNEYQEHCNSDEHAMMILKGRSNCSVDDDSMNSTASSSSAPLANETEQNPHFAASLMKENCIVTSTQSYSSKCDVCNKSFTGAEPYQQHIDSKMHKKKAGLIGQAQNFNCGICREEFLTEELFRIHINSDDHKKMIVLRNPMHILNSNSSKEANASFDEIKCDACKMSFNGPIPYDQHVNSENHKKKLQMINIQPVVSSVNGNAALSGVSNIISVGPYFCDVCKIPCSGPEPFRDHINSKKHIKKAGQAEYESKIKALDTSFKDSKMSVDFGINKPNEDKEKQIQKSVLGVNSVDPSELNITSFKVEEKIDFDKKINNIETIDFDKIEDDERMDEDDDD